MQWPDICYSKTITECLIKAYMLLSRFVLCSGFILGLAACGGGSSGTSSAANIASVNAGVDLSVIEGNTATLNVAVYPEGGDVSWLQLVGTGVEITDPTAMTIDIIAPEVSTDTELRFQVSYLSPDGQQVSDEVSVFVENINLLPVALITEPETAIIPHPTFDPIILSAEQSTDPDGDIRSYQWQQVDDHPSLTFTTDLTSMELGFDAPFVEQLTEYIIELRVTDNFDAVSTNTYVVHISAASTLVLANAGEDQSVDEFTQVILDASNSEATHLPLSCVWQSDSTDIVFTDSSICQTSFIAPDVDTQTTYVINLEATDLDNNSNQDSVNIRVNPAKIGRLHDTGVIDCYGESAVITCGGADFPNQDAESGRDEVIQVLDKSGDGNKAFDFTKFDVNGDEVSNSALVFSCVRDNVTGLVWEVKQATVIPEFSQLRGVENHYSMDDSTLGLSSCPQTESCDVETFVATVNDQSYCGGKNWRLPTYMELLSIMDYGDIDNASLLDTEFFPNTPNAVALGHGYYWVSDENAEGGAGGFHWVIDTQSGDDSAILLSNTAYVRLVRTP